MWFISFIKRKNSQTFLLEFEMCLLLLLLLFFPFSSSSSRFFLHVTCTPNKPQITSETFACFFLQLLIAVLKPNYCLWRSSAIGSKGKSRKLVCHHSIHSIPLYLREQEAVRLLCVQYFVLLAKASKPWNMVYLKVTVADSPVRRQLGFWFLLSFLSNEHISLRENVPSLSFQVSLGKVRTFVTRMTCRLSAIKYTSLNQKSQKKN